MKKLYRSRKDKVLGGVVAGFKEYFGLNVDTNVLRLVVAGLTLLMPFMALLYLVAWVIIPQEPEGESDER